jgi:hypothetical protein
MGSGLVLYAFNPDPDGFPGLERATKFLTLR